MTRETPPARAQVCVLIPAYNEARHIGRVVADVRSAGYHALVVDDGSTDGTAEAAGAAGAELIRQTPNKGKCAAMRAGFQAFLRGSWRALVVMDADGQHEAAELDRFAAAVLDGPLDVAVGDRMTSTDDMPWLRVATNRVMSKLISAIVGQKIADTQCGYRAFRRAVIEKLYLGTDHFEIETEVLLEAGRSGFRIGSIPIRTVYADEKSSIRPVRDTIRFIAYLGRYFLRRKSKS